MACIRSSLWILIGLVARAKQIAQLGARGQLPGFATWAIGARSSLEIAAEIGALLISDLLRILLATLARQVWIVGNTQSAYVQIGMAHRALGQTAERQRLIVQNSTTLPANKDVRHRITVSRLFRQT